MAHASLFLQGLSCHFLHLPGRSVWLGLPRERCICSRSVRNIYFLFRLLPIDASMKDALLFAHLPGLQQNTTTIPQLFLTIEPYQIPTITLRLG